MKQNTTILYMSVVVILVAMIGITACDNANPLADQTADSPSPERILGSAPSMVDTTAITFASGVVANTASLDALGQQGDLFQLDASMNDPSVLTSTIHINVPYEPPSSTPGQINMIHQAYKYTPRNITYNGNSQLNYQVDGTSFSATLNSEEQDMMDMIQTIRDHANQAGQGFTSAVNRGSANIASKKSGAINLDEMTGA